MALRDDFAGQLKASMRAGDAPRTSTLRMVLAKLKDLDIAARPNGISAIPDEAILGMLRGMVKSRRESVVLYVRGNRPELAAKEEAEIAVIEGFLPAQMDGAGLEAAVNAAIAAAGAASIKDMGTVMAALKAAHGAALDMGAAGPLVRTKLSA
ncbi:MAG: GatB/YqeY domain-containing protein [Acetobacteraceae bacterium]|nr:GatB/YqeY domain-containing protein [Acetobacteraceae bacterium]